MSQSSTATSFRLRLSPPRMPVDHRCIEVYAITSAMGYVMTTVTAKSARQTFFELIKEVVREHRRFRIQHHLGTAVLIAENDYESLLETLELLSLPGFRQRLKASVKQMKGSNTISLGELFGEKEARLSTPATNHPE